MPELPSLSVDLCKAIIENLDDALFVIDAAGQVVYCNSAAEKLTGYDLPELVGTRCTVPYQCKVGPENCALFRSGEIVNQVIEIRDSQGQTSLATRTARPLVTIDGTRLGVLEILRKIHDGADQDSDTESVLRPSSAGGAKTLVGRSAAIRTIVDTIRRLSASDAPVLITGESGTGKEVAAQAIHSSSRRSRSQLIALNCAALPLDLFESEIFGHVRGSFTGAIRDRKGAVEEASGGTFFLDEIGDMPLSIQAKLLRLLQEKTYQRVGDSQVHKADIRIIAATNVDLAQAVRENRFRQDLYYRLRVVPIHIPPLRERMEDLLPIASYLLTHRSVEAGRLPMRFSPEASRQLACHSWPGNVRELANLIDYVIALAPEQVVSPKDFPSDLCEKQAVESPPPVRLPGQSSANSSPRGRYASTDPLQSEALLIQKTLEANGFHRQKTAQALGMDRVTLYRKMRDYGIEGPR